MSLETIEVIHPWSKEKRTVHVESISKTYISIRWAQSGIYDLNLLKNVLTARSLKARNRASCLWHAVDIVHVREAVAIHFRKLDVKGVVKEESIAHAASMPHQVRKT